ncbi:MAG: hypothetical protein ABI904_01465 [Chloroflexota bacterium]
MKPVNSSNHAQYFLNILIILTVVLSLAVAAIIFNNALRSAPIFLFLLVAGMVIMAVRGLARGGLLGLLIISISIITKQFIGSWSRDTLGFNLLETLLMAGVFSFSGYYHDHLRTYFDEYNDAKLKLQILDLEDTSVGLIKPSIGILRLKEENDRAIRYKRPISLALILVLPKPGKEWSGGEKLSVMRAVATTVKDTTRVLDIPFLLNSDKIALILTDTEINGTNKVINNIQRQLNNGRIVTQTGTSELLQQYAQIRFGYSVFLGYSKKSFDMLEAAELSLTRNVETNVGGIFQNLFIDWEIIGETPSFSTILPAKAKGVLDTSESDQSTPPAIENNQQQ